MYLGIAGEAEWIELLSAAEQVIEERGPEHEACRAHPHQVAVGRPCDIDRLRRALEAIKALGPHHKAG